MRASAAPAAATTAMPASTATACRGRASASAAASAASAAAVSATASDTRNTPPTGAKPASGSAPSGSNTALPTASHGNPDSTHPRSHSASVHAAAAASSRAPLPAGVKRATAQPASAGHSAR